MILTDKMSLWKTSASTKITYIVLHFANTLLLKRNAAKESCNLLWTYLNIFFPHSLLFFIWILWNNMTGLLESQSFRESNKIKYNGYRTHGYEMLKQTAHTKTLTRSNFIIFHILRLKKWILLKYNQSFIPPFLKRSFSREKKIKN